MSRKHRILFFLARFLGSPVSLKNEHLEYEGYAFMGKIYFIPLHNRREK